MPSNSPRPAPLGPVRRVCLRCALLALSLPLQAQISDPLEERQRNIEQLHREAVRRKQQELGPTHAVTASAWRDLGLFLLARDRAAEAEGYLRNALKARESTANSDSLEMARDAFGLAQATHRLDRHEESEALCGRAIRLLKDDGGMDSGLRAQAHRLHAALALERDDLRAAADRYSAAIEVRPDPSSMLDLADVLERLSEPGKAESILSRALELRTAPGTPPHPQTGEILHRLGLLAAHEADYLRARSLLVRAGEAFGRSTGIENESAAAAADSLGNVLRASGELDAAGRVLSATLELRLRILGPNHPEVAATMNNLAGVHHVAQRPGKAEPLYRRAIEILGGSYGDSDIRIADCAFNLGYLLLAKGERAEAAGLFRRVMSILEGHGEGAGQMAAEARSAIATAESR